MDCMFQRDMGSVRLSRIVPRNIPGMRLYTLLPWMRAGMCLADKGSAKKMRLLGRSCPESPADIMSDSETAGRNPDHKLSVKYLQFRGT